MSMLARGIGTACAALLLGLLAYAPLAQGSLTVETEFGLKAGVAVLLVLLGVRLLLPSDRGPRPAIPVILAVLAASYLGTVLISTLVSAYPLGSMRESTRIVVHVAGFFLGASLLGSKLGRTAFATILLVTTALMGVVGLLQIADIQFFPSVAVGRTQITSTFFHYSHYAGFLDLAAPLALAVALLGPRLYVRIPAAIVALLAYSNAALSFSYAGWGALGLATLVLLVIYALRPRFSAGRLAVAGGLAVVALVTGLAVVSLSPRLSGTLPERLTSLLGTRTPDGELAGQGIGRLSSRLAIVRSGVPIVDESPWVGVGPGNFIYAVTKYRPAELDRPDAAMLHGFVNYAHNDYLQVASETGIPSALLFIGFWILVLVLPARHQPSWLALGAKAGIFALLFHGLMDGNLTVNHASAFLAFCTAGVLHGFGRLENESTEKGTGLSDLNQGRSQ
jgi:O-antigen ligase